jgi:hypothetical protein
MDLGVLLILGVGVFFVLAACMVNLFVALKTKETTDAILSELRRNRL